VAEWRNDGLGAHWLAVFRWSVDGRYLYYTNTGSADGCSRFVNGTDLYRLDVSNGEVIEILPEGKTLNLSLSSDESMLAFASSDGQSEVLAVQDLATGTERSVRLFEPNDRVYAWTFGLNAAICGAAGALVAMTWIVHPYLGLPYTVRSFMIVIVAGLGNVPGVLAAGVGLGVAENFAGFILGAEYQAAFVFGLMVLILVWRRYSLGRERKVLR
jgi:hypothetical protein